MQLSHMHNRARQSREQAQDSSICFTVVVDQHAKYNIGAIPCRNSGIFFFKRVVGRTHRFFFFLTPKSKTLFFFQVHHQHHSQDLCCTCRLNHSECISCSQKPCTTVLLCAPACNATTAENGFDDSHSKQNAKL